MGLLITCNKCGSTNMIQNPRIETNKRAKELKCEDCGLEQSLRIVGYTGILEDYE